MNLRNQLMAGFLLAGTALFPLQGMTKDIEGESPVVTPVSLEEGSQEIIVHSRTIDDHSLYANNMFFAYVRSQNNSRNQIAELGLQRLVLETNLRTSVTPVGVVGLDLENDDLSHYPFILFQVTENVPRPSEAALKKMQDYMAGGGKILLDVVDGRATSSAMLKQLKDDLQIGETEILREGQSLTQTFYMTKNLEGVRNRSVYVQKKDEHSSGSTTSGVIISDNNWAGAWSGVISTDERTIEQSIRAGVNIVFYALTGDYKMAPEHARILEMKRQFLKDAEERLLQEADNLTAQP